MKSTTMTDRELIELTLAEIAAHQRGDDQEADRLRALRLGRAKILNAPIC